MLPDSAAAVPSRASKEEHDQPEVIATVIKRLDEVFSSPRSRRASLRSTAATHVGHMTHAGHTAETASAAAAQQGTEASGLSHLHHEEHGAGDHPSLLKHVAPHHHVVDNGSSHVTRHTSHVTRHTSHVTRHTSHVARHTSHVTRHASHVSHSPQAGTTSACRSATSLRSTFHCQHSPGQ